MKRISIFILLLALSCQLSAVSGQQTSCTDTIVERLKGLNNMVDSLRNTGNITAAAKNCFDMIEMVEKNVKKKDFTEKHWKYLGNAYTCLGDFFRDLLILK